MFSIFLQPDYYKDAAHFHMVGDGPEYRLEIPNVKLDFTGTYTIYAKNEHGDAKAIISLQIFARGKQSVNMLGRTLFRRLTIKSFFFLQTSTPAAAVWWRIKDSGECCFSYR